MLTWGGTAWAPATPASSVSYTGASPISVASGVISLTQNNASAGQVLTWSGSAWVPQAPPATGAVVGTAVPLSNGVAAAGTAPAASHEDHRHPIDTTRAPVASPVFTGSLTPADLDNHDAPGLSQSRHGGVRDRHGATRDVYRGRLRSSMFGQEIYPQQTGNFLVVPPQRERLRRSR